MANTREVSHHLRVFVSVILGFSVASALGLIRDRDRFSAEELLRAVADTCAEAHLKQQEAHAKQREHASRWSAHRETVARTLAELRAVEGLQLAKASVRFPRTCVPPERQPSIEQAKRITGFLSRGERLPRGLIPEKRVTQVDLEEGLEQRLKRTRKYRTWEGLVLTLFALVHVGVLLSYPITTRLLQPATSIKAYFLRLLSIGGYLGALATLALITNEGHAQRSIFLPFAAFISFWSLLDVVSWYRLRKVVSGVHAIDLSEVKYWISADVLLLACTLSIWFTLRNKSLSLDGPVNSLSLRSFRETLDAERLGMLLVLGATILTLLLFVGFRVRRLRRPEPPSSVRCSEALRIGVIGSRACRPGSSLWQASEEIGSLLGQERVCVITGGSVGVSAAAGRVARKEGSLVVGIIPSLDYSVEPAEIELSAVSLPIVTNLPPKMRNAITVGNCHAIIAVGGGVGTLNEISIAMAEQVPIVVLRGLGGVVDDLKRLENLEAPREVLRIGRTPKEVVHMGLEEAQGRLRKGWPTGSWREGGKTD